MIDQTRLTNEQIKIQLTTAAERVLAAKAAFLAKAAEQFKTGSLNANERFDPLTYASKEFAELNKSLKDLAELWLHHHAVVRFALWFGRPDDPFIVDREVVECHIIDDKEAKT